MGPNLPKNVMQLQSNLISQKTKFINSDTHLLRPVVSALPLCPHADSPERLVRPVVSAVPLCPRWVFIVPLYPRADTTEQLVRPVMSAVPLCPQITLEIHYILNTTVSGWLSR